MSLSPVAGAILRADIAGVIEDALGADELLIGTRVMPPLPVMERSGQYPRLKIEKGRMLAPTDVKRRGPTSDYPRKSRQWEQDTYTCIEYGLEGLLGNDTVSDLARFFDAEATVARLTQTDLLLAHERRVASAIQDTSTFGVTTSGTAYTSANTGSFDFAFDVDKAKEAIRGRGESTNPSNLTVVIPAAVFPVIRASEKLQKRIFGFAQGQNLRPLTPSEVATALEVNEVLIGRSNYNAAAEGKSQSITDVWADSHIWIGQVQTGDNLMAGGAGRTMFWERDGNLVTVESYDVPEKRSTALRVRHTTDEKIVNANTGQLIATQA